MNTIGNRIKTLREAKGISQTELSEGIGISKQLLYKYEKGLTTNIPSDRIEAIAKFLNTSPAYLMGWFEDKVDDAMKFATQSLNQQQKRILIYFIAFMKNNPEETESIINLMKSMDRSDVNGNS